MKRHIEVLMNSNHKDLAKNLLIGTKLEEYLVTSGLPQDPWDFNSQLNIVRTTESVVAMVAEEGITCTHEDVMLYWLTVLVYGGPHADILRMVAK